MTRSTVSEVAVGVGLELRGFTSVESFLAGPAPRVGCLVVDSPVRPVGSSAVEYLREAGVRSPVLLISGPTTVRAAVRAMESGAAAVVEKPVSVIDLRDRIIRAVTADAERLRSEAETKEGVERLSRLTTKEQRTLALVLDGMTNKQIAEELGLSVRAVEDRRARTIKRAGVRNVLELAKLVQMTGWQLPAG